MVSSVSKEHADSVLRMEMKAKVTGSSEMFAAIRSTT
jgi:hypothetical protein